MNLDKLDILFEKINNGIRDIYGSLEGPKINVDDNDKPPIRGVLRFTFDNGSTRFIPVRAPVGVLRVDFESHDDYIAAMNSEVWDYDDPLN